MMCDWNHEQDSRLGFSGRKKLRYLGVANKYIPGGPVKRIRGLTLPNSFVYLVNSGRLRKTYMESNNAVFVFSLHHPTTL